MHYQRQCANGNLDRARRECTVDDCTKLLFRDGYCRTHWTRWDEFGDPLKVRICAVDGCAQQAATGKRRWCVMHYTRWAKHGDVGKAESRVFQPPFEASEGYRWCVTCRAQCPVSEFHRDKNSLGGYARSCRGCCRDVRTAQNYGIKPEAYRRLLEEQQYVCRICRKPETATHQSGTLRRLAVDHDHKCCPGKKSCGQCIRGLLCARCNSALGLVDEDGMILAEMISYLADRQRSNR